MSSVKWKLEDLPAGLQQQALAQLGRQGQQEAQQQPSATPVHCPPPVRTPCPKQPNKTEQRYNIEQLAGRGSYESITLRLPGGSRYTPDWVTWDATTGRMTCHEVKGNYRHHSQGRAATAFRECIVAFPYITFVWAQLQDSGWKISRASQSLPLNP